MLWAVAVPLCSLVMTPLIAVLAGTITFWNASKSSSGGGEPEMACDAKPIINFS